MLVLGLKYVFFNFMSSMFPLTFTSSSEELSSSDSAGGGVGARKLYDGFGFYELHLKP